MRHCVRPCRACPWRVEADAADIPRFELELAEGLAGTCPDARGMGPEVGASVFACHESRPGEELACSGWLAVHGAAHPLVRLAVLRGQLPRDALTPGDGWPALHASFGEMIEKLRRQA